MSAATTHNSNTTNNAGVPPAPSEAHQKAGRAKASRVMQVLLMAVFSAAFAGCAQHESEVAPTRGDGTESFHYKANVTQPTKAPAASPDSAADSFHYTPNAALFPSAKATH